MLTTREQIRVIRDSIALLVDDQIIDKDQLSNPHTDATPPIQSRAEIRAHRISALHNWSLELRGKAPCHGNVFPPYDIYVRRMDFMKDAKERAEVEEAEAEERERLRAIA